MPDLQSLSCPYCGGMSLVKPVAAPKAPDAKAPTPKAPARTPARTARRDNELATRTAGGTLAMRDDAAGDGRTIDGVAVIYGETTPAGGTLEFGPGMRETFAPGAFRDALAARGDRPLPVVDRHHGNVIGAVQLYDTPDALRYRGRLLTNQAARDYAERVAAGINGVSIEFVIGQVRRAGDLVTHTAVRAISALAASYAPAYLGASASVRDMEARDMTYCEHCGAQLTAGIGCSCQGATAARTATITEVAPAARDAAPQATGSILNIDREGLTALVRQAADESFRRHIERGFGAPAAADPLADIRAYRSLGQLVYDAAQPGATTELRGYASRVLADQLTTDNNAGVTTAGIVGDIAGIVSRGRRAITAFGGPRAMSGAGMSIDWPYFDGTLSSLIGVQAVQKTEITSVKVEIKKGTEAIQTFAGGSDISYQLIRRSSPEYLDVYGRIMLTAWGVVTDAAFVTELETGTVTVDTAEPIGTVDGNEMKGLLVDAALLVETASGAPAEFVLASSTAFASAAKLLNPGPVFNAVGTMDLRRLEVNVGGLPIIHTPALTAGKLIVSNRLAAGWFEDGPFQATEEDVAKLGRNVAYWSLGAPARFIPGAIVEVYDVTPV